MQMKYYYITILLVGCFLVPAGYAGLTGNLTVILTPPSAGIHIDDEFYYNSQNLPVNITDLAYGSHDVYIYEPGFAEIFDTITISQPDTEKRYILQATGSALTVFSVPVKATILLDGKTEGAKTNVSYAIDPGTHSVSIEMAGYEPYKETFTVALGEEKKIIAVLKEFTVDAKIEIYSAPESASVYIDGELQEKKTPGSYFATPEKHQVKISLPRYQDYIDEISLPEDTYLAAHLVQITSGELRIDTTPEGATIKINGENKGKTPLTLSDLPFGEYTVEFKKEGYPTESKTITLKSESLPVNHKFTTDKAIVRIRSIPTKADIMVSDEVGGYKTPETLTLEPRTLTLLVAKQGYSSVTKKLDLLAGDDISLDFVLSGPGGQATQNTDGSINVGITSEPEGANVYIDDVLQGAKTPGIFKTGPGDLQVRLSYPGYQMYNEEIAFPDESPLFVHLIPVELSGSTQKSAELTLNVHPADSKIKVDDMVLGAPPYIVQLEPGDHVIRVTHSDYNPYEEAITLHADQKKEVEITLSPAVIPDEEEAPAPELTEQERELVGLKIVSDPSGAVVLVNDNEVGKTPFFKDVPPRVYKVVLTYKGRESAKTIDLTDGIDKTYTVDFRSGDWSEAGVF